MKILGKYKNGNYITVIFSDGTKIRKTNEDNFIPAFAENCDIKITDVCDMNCPMCHENSTTSGKHGNLNLPFLDALHPYTELAIGGGNALAHPDLIPFLEKLKRQKVIANITVNQIHFEKEQELIKKLVEQDLIKGIGVSLVNPTDDFIELVGKYPTAVIHTIAGILSKEDIEKLANKNLKLLILGYKDFRRGSKYLVDNKVQIAERQKYLYDNLKDVTNKFAVVSFDNLALSQLNVKRLMTQEEWDTFYMGDDGTMTFYIDAVKEQFASSSVSTKRYPILDSIDEMFKTVRSENVLL